MQQLSQLSLPIPYKRGLRGLSRGQFIKHLRKRYGPQLLKDLNVLFHKPFWNLTDVAQKHGFSREYARQLFAQIYRIPYRQIQERKARVRRAEESALNCTKDPVAKLATYKGKKKMGAQVELMVKQKCEELGFEYKCEPNGGSIDFEINGYMVEVKSMSKSRKTSKRGPKYFGFYLLESQRKLADFMIAYVWPTQTFYVIPVTDSQYRFYIRDGVSTHYSAGTNHAEHKEAWHLLK